MNGHRILLDTNAFIYFFEGRSNITHLVVTTPEIYFSPISEIELLSGPHLTPDKMAAIRSFLALCHRVDVTLDVINQAITLRRKYRFKIPDAIIAASAFHLAIPLVSADTDFKKAAGLILISDI